MGRLKGVQVVLVGPIHNSCLLFCFQTPHLYLVRRLAKAFLTVYHNWKLSIFATR
jgi:hypothetical protein